MVVLYGNWQMHGVLNARMVFIFKNIINQFSQPIHSLSTIYWNCLTCRIFQDYASNQFWYKWASLLVLFEQKKQHSVCSIINVMNSLCSGWSIDMFFGQLDFISFNIYFDIRENILLETSNFWIDDIVFSATQELF